MPRSCYKVAILGRRPLCNAHPSRRVAIYHEGKVGRIRGLPASSLETDQNQRRYERTPAVGSGGRFEGRLVVGWLNVWLAHGGQARRWVRVAATRERESR